MCGAAVSRGEMSDIVLMEGRGFGFVTYADPQCAQAFLEVGLLQPAPTEQIVKGLYNMG